MNAVNSAVKRKTRVTSEASGHRGSEDSPGQTLILQAMQGGDEDDSLNIEAEDAVRPASETKMDELEIEKAEAEEGPAASPTLTIQRSKSESSSDTSKNKVMKKHTGLLKFNLLRRKGEAARSASSTPDMERNGQNDARTTKQWRSWGGRSGPNNGIYNKEDVGKEGSI